MAKIVKELTAAGNLRSGDKFKSRTTTLPGEVRRGLSFPLLALVPAGM